MPGFAKANFHDIPDPAFDLAVKKLESAGVGVYCFGSTIMNWSKKIGDPFDLTLAEVKRAIPRMQRLGTKYIRIMSFKPGDEEYQHPRRGVPAREGRDRTGSSMPACSPCMRTA